MFGPFKKRTEKDKLEKQYRRLLNESFRLSKINRAESDKKQAEAEQILKMIEALDREQGKAAT